MAIPPSVSRGFGPTFPKGNIMAKFNGIATSAPAHVVEFVKEWEKKNGRLTRQSFVAQYGEGKDPGQPDLRYPSGTYTNHENEKVQELVFDVMQLTPRPSKKEASFALHVQHPELIAIAVRAHSARTGAVSKPAFVRKGTAAKSLTDQVAAAITTINAAGVNLTAAQQKKVEKALAAAAAPDTKKKSASNGAEEKPKRSRKATAGTATAPASTGYFRSRRGPKIKPDTAPEPPVPAPAEDPSAAAEGPVTEP